MSSEAQFVIGVIVYLVIASFFSVMFVVGFFRHRKFKARYAPIISLEAEERRLKSELRELALDVDHEVNNLKNTRDSLKQLKQIMVPLEDAHNLSEDGFQEPKFQLDDHADYVFAIKQVKEDQKESVRRKRAVIGQIDWTLGDSKTEGRKMVNRAIRLTLRAFNNECDSRVSKINWKNLGQVKQRILASRESLSKLNESLHVEISNEYLELKFREAELVNEERITKERERERLREERAAEREEAKAQREIQAELNRQKKLEAEQFKALNEVRERLKTASIEHRAALELEAGKLEEDLAAASIAKGRLLSMAEHTRIGHLYVISNRGAFGERMIKIGMTRRLEPLDRVKELGDASVPFPFDVHAMVFAEDAPRLEKELHEKFDEFRVNRLNRRKEFFNVPLEAVHAELESRIPGAPFEIYAPSMEYEASR